MPIRSRGGAFQADLTDGPGRRWRPSFPTRDAAESWELESKQRLRRGEEPILPKEGQTGFEDIDLADLLVKTRSRHWAGSRGEDTAVKNASDVVAVLGEEALAREVNVSSVDRLVEHFREAGLSNGTINRKLAALSKMMRHAQERGWIPKLPRIDKVKESEPRLRWVQEDEETAILGYFQEHHPEMKDLVTVLVDTGLRLGEGLRLKWSDIREGRVFVWGTEAKSKKSRAVPLTSRARGLLATRRLADPVSARVFSIETGTAEWWWRKMKRDAEMSDDDLVIHSLRHTFITRLIRLGVPLPTVKALAGHANIETTMRYVHASSMDDLTDAVGKLDGSRQSLIADRGNACDTSVTESVTSTLQQTAA